MKKHLFTASIVLFSASSLAAERLALVIGNSDYQNLPKLTNPHYDAVGIAERLENLGFEVTLVENVDAYNLNAAVANFSNKINRDTELSFLFYAGHGVEIYGKSYLLPVDLRLNQKSGLNLNQQYSIGGIEARGLIDQIVQAGARTNIMIFDACRNLPSRGVNSFHIAGKQYSSTLIAYSTQSGQTAADGIAGENSPYTRALLKYLGTPDWSIFQTFNATNSEVNSKEQLAEMHVTSIKDIILNPEQNQSAAPPPLSASAQAQNWAENIWQWADQFQLSPEIIPRDFNQLLALTEIYIDGTDLTTTKVSYLPPEIGQLKNLQKLIVVGSALKFLPPEIGQLKNLQELDLRDNELPYFPPEISQLSQLKILTINENQFSALPPEIGALSQLQHLNIEDNQLTTLPEEIGKLTALQELVAGNNQLSLLPNSFVNLKQLKSLSLNNNKLQSLPNFGGFSSLENLFLSNNQLTAFPANIGQLKSLQILYIYNNQLTSIPAEIGQLNNLIRLYVDENKLSFVPNEIGQLTKLQELYLNQNQLTTLPESIGQLTNLDTLGLFKNQLQSLPNSLLNLRNLSFVNIKKNPNLRLTPAQQQFLAKHL